MEQGIYYYTMTHPERNVAFRQYVHDINRYRFNWHREVEITLILAGEAEFSVEGTTHLLREDDLILVNSNRGHASLVREPGSIAMVLRFEPALFRPYSDDYTNLEFTVLSNETNRHTAGYTELRRLMAVMLRAGAGGDYAARLMAEGAFLQIGALLLGAFPPQQRTRQGRAGELSHRATISRIIDYTEENYTRKISLDEIAAISKYNRTYVSSFFKSNVGITFYEHLTRIRLRHALHELNTTERTLTEIALNSGFPDLKAFTTCFKRNFQKSPSRYREEVRNDPSRLDEENQRNYLPHGFGGVEEKVEQYLTPVGLDKGNRPDSASPAVVLDDIRRLSREILTLAGDNSV